MIHKALLVILLTCCGYYTQAQQLQQPAFYLSHPQVSQDAKDYYAKGMSAGVAKVSSVLDSVFTANDTTRPFYVQLICRMLGEADTPLLEELNIVCKYVTEHFPGTVSGTLFSPELPNQSRSKELWVQRIATEIRISCPGDLMECFKEARMAALNNCDAEEKMKLETVFQMVRKNLNLFKQG